MAKRAKQKSKAKKPLKSFKQLGAAMKKKKGVGPVGAAIRSAIAATQTRPIDKIKLGKRFRKDLGDVAGLARSIDERGALLHPIVITPDNKLIAGERRLAAWKICKLSEQGKQPIPVNVVDIDAIIAGERDENAERKDFTPSESVAIAKALEPLERKKAQARRAHGETAPGKTAGPTLFGTPAKPEEKGRALDKVAAATGRDRKTIAKASAVVDAAKQHPDKYGKLQEDMDRTGRVDGPFKRLQNMQASEKIRSEKPPLPGNGPYRGGIIDFPWPADPEHPERTEGRGYYPYPTMALPEIDAFDIRGILHDDAVVGVWITNFHLARGDHLGFLKTNGLEPVTIRTWNKPHFGNGQIMRGQTEHMIIATRGNPTVDGSSISTRLDAPAGKEHSEKPAQSYVDFERLVAAPKYFELFARRPMPPNWDGHGNQVGTLVDTGKAPRAEIDPTKPLKVKTLLEALEAIESGRAIVVQGKKITDQVKRCTTGGEKKPKLTKDGVEQLADLRRQRDDDERVRALPSDLRALTGLYTAGLGRLNDAMLAADRPGVEAIGHELWLIARAANKGDNHDRGEGGSHLRDVTAAPIGIVPTWGQRGMFGLEVDGVPYIVSICDWLDNIGGMSVYATDPVKPCILAEAAGDSAEIDGPWFEPSGGRFNDEHWLKDMSVAAVLGKTVEDYCRTQIRALGTEKVWIAGRKRAPKPALPTAVYRLPASWDHNHGFPIELSKRELDAVRPTESMVKHDVSHAGLQRALQSISDGKGFVGGPMVAHELIVQKLVSGKTSDKFKLIKAGQERLEVYRANAAAKPARPSSSSSAIANEQRNKRTSWPAGHVVSMTIDHDAKESVGTCECGFVARVPRDGKSRLERLQRAAEMDDLVEAHWAKVEGSPNPPPQEGMRDPISAPPGAPIAEDDDGLFNEMFRAKPKADAA